MNTEQEKKVLERFARLTEEIEKETNEILGVVVGLPVDRSNLETHYEWNGAYFVRTSPNSPSLAWSRKTHV